MNLSVKNRTLIFVIILLLLFSFALLGLIYLQQKSRLSKIEYDYYANTKALYHKVSHKYENFYTNRILANINSAGVLEAFVAQNRDELYRLSMGRWQTLQKENPYLVTMQFHMPDGTVFLRMHEPSRYGDNLMNKRSMIREVHSKHKPVFGFEKCSKIIAYRIVHPIFLGEEYVGALEFGLRADYILNEMNYYQNINGALFEVMDDFTEENTRVRFGNYLLSHNLLVDETLLDYMPKGYNFESFINIELPHGSHYSVYSFDLTDFEGEVVTKVLFFKDTTKDVYELNSNMENLTLLLVLVIILMIVIVNLGFNKDLRSLEKNYKEMQQYRAMIDNYVLTSSTDLEGKITKVSEAFCKMSGYERHELIGKTHKMLRHPDVPKELYAELWADIKSGKVWSGELKNIKKDGSFYWVYITIEPKYSSDGRIVAFDSIMQDITDKKINDELLITDGLTHVYNRHLFNEVFPRLINITRRDGGYLSFLILDVDNFKLYNDTYGHHAGDIVLKSVADVLKSSLKRGDDYVFRLGGEEFALLYKSANEDDAYLYAQKIKKEIVSLGIEHVKNQPYGVITASFGLVTLKDEFLTNMDHIYTQADELMYRAKQEGKNRVVNNTTNL